MSGLRTHTIRIAGAAAVVLALVATACGNKDGTAAGGSPSGAGEASMTPAPSSAGDETGGGSSTPKGSKAATIEAAKVGDLGTVLVDSKGFTLYRLEGETSSDIKCTGSCVEAWPPVEASGTPAAGSGATGKLGTLERPDGISQVTYDGVPLYTFAGDSAPGQSNGQGIQGAWFAVTPAGESAKGGDSGGASPTSGGPGYGY